VDWLEQNLDAYRIIAEILNDLRRVLRDQLEALHGKTWYEVGLPDGLLDRLIEIKEKEKAIDWYESEYQQIMDYAVFPDLLEILEHNSDSFPQIMRLAPTTALLHARFLELEVMRAKLGRARPISETELAFLGTFHLRFRKAIEEFSIQGPTTPLVRPQQPAEPVAEAAVAAEEPVAAGSRDESFEITEPAPDVKEPGPPRRSVTTPGEKPPSDVEEVSEDQLFKDDEEAPADDVESPEEEAPASPTEEPDVNAIDAALEEGDDIAVLRQLYREVTKTAEGIWTSDVLPNTRIWKKVSASRWYEEGFSRLGLKPVSDYYEIIAKVDQQMRDGSSKEELQEYLKGSNFAQILLALRDMFQRNQI
jgi:hypothetical protein